MSLGKSFLVALASGVICFLFIKIFFDPIVRITEENVSFSIKKGNDTHFQIISFDTVYINPITRDTIRETVTQQVPHENAVTEYDSFNVFNINITYPEKVIKQDIQYFILKVDRKSECVSKDCNLDATLNDFYKGLLVESERSKRKEVINKNEWYWSFKAQESSTVKLSILNRENGARFEKEVKIIVANSFWDNISLWVDKLKYYIIALAAIIGGLVNIKSSFKRKRKDTTRQQIGFKSKA